MDKINQKGVTILAVVIIAVVAAMAGIAGWTVYRTDTSERNTVRNEAQVTDDSKNPQEEIVNSQNLPETQINTSDNSKTCNTGVIIVYFNAEVSKDRQKEIIANQHNTSIVREYDSLNGYALRVGEGREKATAGAFLQYTEVSSAQPEGCPATTTDSSPDSAD